MPNAKIKWNKFDSGGDVIQAFGANSADIGLIGSQPGHQGAVRAAEHPDRR